VFEATSGDPEATPCPSGYRMTEGVFGGLECVEQTEAGDNDSLFRAEEAAPSSVCSEPPVTGQCRAYIPSWYFDPSSGDCKEFVFGGCGGNGNRFDEKEECLLKCKG
jgi:Kunitz/Bovine pancreatic trypsin inhibitor domain